MENALMVVASVLAAGLIGAGAALGAALGNSRVTSTTIECMARQPEQASNFQVTMFSARAGVQLSGYHVHLCRPD